MARCVLSLAVSYAIHRNRMPRHTRIRDPPTGLRYLPRWIQQRGLPSRRTDCCVAIVAEYGPLRTLEPGELGYQVRYDGIDEGRVLRRDAAADVDGLCDDGVGRIQVSASQACPRRNRDHG